MALPLHKERPIKTRQTPNQRLSVGTAFEINSSTPDSPGRGRIYRWHIRSSHLFSRSAQVPRAEANPRGRHVSDATHAQGQKMTQVPGTGRTRNHLTSRNKEGKANTNPTETINEHDPHANPKNDRLYLKLQDKRGAVRPTGMQHKLSEYRPRR